jgi:hypothetical protein
MMVRFGVAILFGLLSSFAAAQPITIDVADKTTFTSPQSQTWTVTLPDYDPSDRQVRLSLEARRHVPAFSGSNPFMDVFVNGKQVVAEHLLNKRNSFKMANGMEMTWCGTLGYPSRWRVIHAPDFQAALTNQDSPYSIGPEDEPYRFVFDISKFAQPGENDIRVSHAQHELIVEPTTMVVRQVKVEIGPPIAPPATAIAPPPTGPLPRIVAGGPRPVAMIARQSAGGVIDVQTGGAHFQVRTRMSLPDSAWREADGEPGDANSVTWQAGAWRVERRITVLDDHIEVDDTLTNTSDELAGVMIEHGGVANAPPPPEAVYIAGSRAVGERDAEQKPANPAAFAMLGDVGVGVIAEDDVFRVHIESFTDGERFGIADRSLGLAPGDRVTLEWSIYPVLPRAQQPALLIESNWPSMYWDFVNAVRRNWESNLTIDGPFIFEFDWEKPDHEPMDYAAWMRQRGMRIVASDIPRQPDGKIAHGTGILDVPQWRDAARRWVRQLESTAAGIDSLAYFHAQISNERGSREKYSDSRLLDAAGNHLVYPSNRIDIPLYVPTLDNSYGEALLRAVDVFIHDIGFSGLYWDQVCYSVYPWAYGEPWDGVSVQINRRTHAVSRKASSVSLITQPLRLAIIDRLHDAGKYLMGNSQPHTRTMLDRNIVRFAETGGLHHLTKVHFGCPLGLGNYKLENSYQNTYINARRILEHGAVYCGHLYRYPVPDWNFVSVLYPTTPVEIHAGYVLAAERIMTVTSGIFAFPDGACADVYVIDGEGHRLRDSDMVVEHQSDEQYEYEVRIPGDHMVVLVR